MRVAAWESSDRIGTINKLNFPNGWVEDIDKDAFHFVVFDNEDKIIASASISLHNSIDELPDPSVFKEFQLPTDKPFVFYSRLVVSPENRSIFTFQKLDQIRIQFSRDNNIPFALVTYGSKRLKSMLAASFEILGKAIIEFADIRQETVLILFTNKITNGK